jgi:glyoxylase-like metal-dependent hydrolase (beta-lactamase superfamily II)
MAAVLGSEELELEKDGIHVIAVPTPFLIGSVNVYLIEDEPLTLIDSGPASTASLEALEIGLAALGHTLEDLELLLVTHQHFDHLGLTRYLAKRSGARIACLEQLAVYASAFADNARAEDLFAADLMALHGVPAEMITALRRFASLLRHWGSSFNADVTLADGMSVSLRDRELGVIHAPGHSPTDTLFFDKERGIAFVGDHLLSATSSNALVSRLPVDPGEADKPPLRRPALIEYLESLRATRGLNANVVLGGHGAPITDARGLIDERLEHHAQRADVVLSLVRERSRSAHEIGQEIWEGLDVTQAFLALSEVLGHLDLLIEASLVVEVPRTDAPVLFEAA